MRAFLRHLFYSLAPEFVLRRHVARRLEERARALARDAASKSEPEALMRLLWQYCEFRPIQIHSEILRLLGEIQSLQPRVILEIGAARGGTTFLFSRVVKPGAQIISVDLGFDESRLRAVRTIVDPSIALHALSRDSHSASTIDHIRSFTLAPLDFLFIDGDHSYEGVKQDFQMYSPLIRKGGLIAFHDIVRNANMRPGTATHVDWGGVPVFWNEIKTEFGDRAEEIVHDPNQDGYGIGLLRL